jgi:ATP-binding cassette subfamily F protein 3
MISLNDITVAYGSFTLLDDVSFHISDHDRIGLVGKNGAGKSTLLKIIMGEQTPTSGSVTKPNEVNIGYLPQIMEHHHGHRVIDETMTAFEEVNRLNTRLEELKGHLETRTDYESDSYNRLIAEMSDVSERISYFSNETPEVEAEKVLLGLGFKPYEFERLTDTFSQGWNMRIELAKLLLRRPDVILLDEPTNHLDIESIQWLEDYLKTFNGSLVLISHDRRFLDAVTTRTVEIVVGHIYDYKAPYSQFVELRKERIAQQRAAYDNQQKMIEKTEEFIDKFRYKPTKSNQVQARIKALDKVDRIEMDDEDLSQINIKFPPAPRAGDVVFQAEDLKVGYPSDEPDDPRVEDGVKVVLNKANIIIRRGDKVAFVGRNGEGKTTMMKVIIGDLPVMAGTAKVGYNVDLGYYAQNQEDILDPSDTVFGTLDKIAVGDIRFHLKDLLGAFLFHGEDVDKKVSVLSGGERSRLAMAKLIIHPYNVLALDEPTNHMDIRSKEVIKSALKKFDGTLIIVSHDRAFLDGLVDKIYEFKDGGVREHLGGIDDFMRRKKIESMAELEKNEAVLQEKAAQKAAEANAKGAASEKSGALSWKQQQEQRKVENKRKQLEAEIDKLEKKMKAIEAQLSAPTPQTDIMELTRDYLNLKRDVDEKTEEWASL